MNRFIKTLSMAATVALLGAGAQAAIIGFSGDTSTSGTPFQLVSPPPGSVADDAPGFEATGIAGFDELQGVLLGSAIDVDGGSIAAGTLVDSHMIFLNSPGKLQVQHTVTLEFSGQILGVMSDNDGLLEAASNGTLGLPGTAYPGSFNNRGFESNNPDAYAIVMGGTFLEVTMFVTEPGDWIRVVTAAPAPIPVPASAVLLGSALLGAGAWSRRRKAKNA